MVRLSTHHPLVQIDQPLGEIFRGSEEAGGTHVRIAENRVLQTGLLIFSIGVCPIRDDELVIFMEVGPGHSQRSEDVLRHPLGEGRTRHPGDDDPEESEPGIAVGHLLAGREVQLLFLGHDPEHLVPSDDVVHPPAGQGGGRGEPRGDS
jgi:hypothetical protein